MTEIEWKLALDASEYRRLLQAVGKAATARRTANRYWETADHALRRAGSGLRLRESPGRAAVLTFKYALSKSRSSGGVHRRGEVECRVSPKTARRLRQGTVSPLDLNNSVARRARQLLGRPALRALGDLNLLRKKVRWETFVLEIDRFSVGGKTYYEVEIEHGNPAHVVRRLRPFFRELGIRWRPRAATKVSYLYRQK